MALVVVYIVEFLIFLTVVESVVSIPVVYDLAPVEAGGVVFLQTELGESVFVLLSQRLWVFEVVCIPFIDVVVIAIECRTPQSERKIERVLHVVYVILLCIVYLLVGEDAPLVVISGRSLFILVDLAAVVCTIEGRVGAEIVFANFVSRPV